MKNNEKTHPHMNIELLHRLVANEWQRSEAAAARCMLPDRLAATEAAVNYHTKTWSSQTASAVDNKLKF